MIVKKRWMKYVHNSHDLYKSVTGTTKEIHYVGYFLFGFIPLFIEQEKVSYRI